MDNEEKEKIFNMVFNLQNTVINQQQQIDKLNNIVRNIDLIKMEVKR